MIDLKSATKAAFVKFLVFVCLISVSVTGMAQNVSATWGANSSTAWYTTSNWVGGAYAGVGGAAASNSYVATFTSAYTGTTPGINMGTNSLNLGAVSIDSRTTALNIGNSSGTAGVLRLYGATVNSIGNVIVRNNGAGLFTLQATQSGTMGVVLSNATDNIINLDNSGAVLISAIVSGTGKLTKAGSGAGMLTLSGNNTYSGGTTVNTGELRLNPSANETQTGGVTLNGGTLSTTGIAASRTITQGILTLTDNTTLALGTAAHTLTFAASSGATWTTGKKITITGWTGILNGATTGTAGKVFVGSSASGLTCAQLAQVQFLISGTNYPALQLSTGELVPISTPTTTSVSPTSAIAGGSGFTLTVNGTNFISGQSKVTWEGAVRTTTFISSTQLTAVIPGTDIAAPGSASVEVITGCAESNAQTFTINAGGANTISTATSSFGPYCNSSPNNVMLNFAQTGTFTGQFDIQISDASGAFPSDATSQLLTFVSSGPTYVTATMPASFAAGTGYRIRVVNATPTYFTSGDNGSNIIVTAPVTPAVSIAQTTGTNPTCAGSSVAFTATPTNGGTPSYQWKINGSNTGTNSATLTTSALTNGQTVTCVMTSSLSCVTAATATSTGITMTVNTAPAITTPPTAPAAVCAGSGTATMSVIASGTNLTYTWRKVTTPVVDGAVYSGQGTTTLTLTNPATTDGGSYNVSVSNSGCTAATSSSVTVSVTAAPTLSSQPNTGTQTVCQNTTFSNLICGGTGITSYQWYKNTTASNSGGYPIPGATSTSYTPLADTVGDRYYYCAVTGTAPCTPVTSSVSGVRTVLAAPATPAGTITANANPACTGPVVLTYSAPDPDVYWETTTSNTVTTFPTTSTYSASATGSTIHVRSNLGTCWVTGPNSGTITIYTQLSITSSPGDKTVVAGDVSSFTIATSGSVVSRQWQVNTGSGWADLTNATPYSGATAATLNLSTTTALMDGYQYRCIAAASPCVSDTSSPATLYVNSVIWSNVITATNPSATNPYITNDVKDANVTVSGITRGPGLTAVTASNRFTASGWSTTTFDANDYFEFVLTPASGYEINFTSFDYSGQLSGGSPSYAFRSSLDGFTGNIGAPTTAGLTISLAATAYQHISGPITFRLYGYGMSTAATTFSVNDFEFVGKIIPSTCTVPTITGSTPASTSCGAGSLTLGATASAGMVYWYTAATGGSPIDSGTTLTRSFSATTSYYAGATDGACTSVSRTQVTGTVTTQPGTPSASTPAAVCAGTSATITGAGGGALTYTYWTLASGGSAVTAVTAPPGNVSGNNLTTPTTLTANTYTYYVQGESGSCISAARQAVTVTVNAVPANPTGTIGVAANPACGSTTLTYSSPSASIYWQTASGNSSTANPTTTAYTLSSSGTIYARAITVGCPSVGTVSSGPVTINANTAITTAPSNQSVVTGATATFTVVASGASLTYQWRKGGSNISGATSATYTIPAVVAGDAGSYDVVVTGTCGTVTSAAVTLTVTNFVYQAGDYRPMYDYDDLSYNNSTGTTNNWEYFDGTTWTVTPGDKSPQNATTKPTRIVINKIVTGGGNNTAAYNNIVIIAGGELELNATGTATGTFIASGKSLEVKTGGKLTINGQIKMVTGDSLIVRNGAEMVLNSASIDNSHALWAGTELFEPGSNVSVTNWGFTGTGSGSLMNVYGTISDNAAGYKFGILDVNINPGFSWVLVGGSFTVNLCDTLNLSNASSNPVTFLSNTSSPSVTVKRINHHSGVLGLTASFSGGATQTVNILENLSTDGGTLKLFHNGGGTSTSTVVNLGGNLTIGTGVTVSNDATSGTAAVVNFNGTATQYIDAASTVTGWPMNFNSGTYVALRNNDLTVNSNSSLTAIMTVKTGATFDFGFAADGVTGTVVKKVTTAAAGTNQFASQQGSTLKITSADGLQQSTSTGNLQFTTGNKSINQLATFWYTGRVNQVTGDAITSGANGKQFIVEMGSNSLSCTLSQSTGVTTDATLVSTGGKLDIRRGKFLETTSAYFTSSTGTLSMAGGTLYQVPALSANNTDVIPRMSGATGANPYILAGGTVELAGAGKQILRGSRSYFNVKYSGSNSYGTDYKNLSNGATINDSLIVTGSAVVNCVDTSGNAVAFTGAGGVVMDGGRLMIKMLNTTSPELTGVNIPYSLTGGTVEFYGSNGSNHQVIRGTENAGNISYYNLDINAATANTTTYNVGLSASLGIKGALTVYTPAVFQLDETENVSGVGSFEVQAGATFKYGSANGVKTSGTGTSDGNIRITGTRTLSASASYGFVGNGAMVSGNGLPSSMVNMYIDKTGGTDVVTLTNSATATGVISFTKGMISTGSNELISSNTSTSSITGYGLGKYVIGNLRRYVSTSGSYDFPVGNSSYYDLGTISFNGQTGITSLVGFFNTGQSGSSPATATCAINGSGINDYLNNGFWTFTPNATMTGGSYDVTLNAMGYTNAGSDATKLGVIKRTSSSAAWLGCGNLGGSPQSSSYGSHSNGTQSLSGGVATAVRTGVEGFSEFGIGLMSGTPLPVKLLYLNANAVDNKYIRLDWATASEINNLGFEIERSKDGLTFESAGWVDGSGTTNNLITYTKDDRQVAPNVIYYYRLKQTDVDGKYEYSNIVSATLVGENGFVMQTLHPNPAAGQVTIDIVTDYDQAVNVSFTDMLGRAVLAQSWQLSAGMNDHNFDISSLAEGVYHVTVKATNNYYTKTLVVTR